MNKMHRYSVLLEGSDGSFGYFMTFCVAARDVIQAESLARDKAKELGPKIVGVEEITEIRKDSNSDPRFYRCPVRAISRWGNKLCFSLAQHCYIWKLQLGSVIT